MNIGEWLKSAVEHFRTDPLTADLYGLILYTREHANINKVIHDDFYWQSFDKASGRNWVIFSNTLNPGNHFELKKSPKNYLHSLHGIPAGPDCNTQILHEFDIASEAVLPILVVFTYLKNDTVIYRKIALSDKSTEKSYESIKDAIVLITNAVSGLQQDNYKNSEGVIAAANLAIDSHNTWMFLKKSLSVYSWLKGLIP